MYRRCCFSLALTMALAGAAPTQDVEPPRKIGADYFPLKVGTTWTYEAKGQEIEVTVAKHEKLGDVTCARLDTKVGGKVFASEHVAVGKDGVYRHSMQGQTVKPPVRFLKLPCKAGDKWKVETKVAEQALKVEYTLAEGEVKVPTGKYKAFITETNKFDSGGTEMQVTTWYARGVGPVKMKTSVAGQEIEIELKKFAAGK